MRRPRPGLVLVRRPDLEEKLPGGRIILPSSTVEQWTLGQAECVAVGLPGKDADGEEIPLDPRIKPGAWLMTRFRSWVSTDRPDEFLIRQADVVAVFRETPDPSQSPRATRRPSPSRSQGSGAAGAGPGSGRSAPPGASS